MIVFTFPGQGSQTPGMGTPWRDHPSWELVVEASDAAGRDVERLLIEADADELRETRNSQLATLVLSLVVLDAIERVGAAPGRLAGHSLGEYSALVAGGALTFADGVRLVGARADAMQEAADTQPGTMAAVLGLDDAEVDDACGEVAEAWVANFNAPGQVVIAGTVAGVDEASTIVRARGAKRVMPLPVGGAFHSPLMASARPKLAAALATTAFRDTDVGLVANVDAATHQAADDWARLLDEQLTSPVRWRQTLHALADDGASTFVEVGPGTVLTGLAKRAVRGRTALSISTPEQLDALIHELTTPSTEGRADEGEALFIRERVVVTSGAGLFEPEPCLRVGAKVAPGSLLGRVGTTDVRAGWEGEIMGILAEPGERLAAWEPVAWMTAT